MVAWSLLDAGMKASVQVGVLMNAGLLPDLDAPAAVTLSLGFVLLVEVMMQGQHEQRMHLLVAEVPLGGFLL